VMKIIVASITRRSSVQIGPPQHVQKKAHSALFCVRVAGKKKKPAQRAGSVTIFSLSIE
jgi:hypothetical protein